MIEKYKQLRLGHLYQKSLTGTVPDYSSTYSKERYDTYKTNDAISKIRFDTIRSAIGNFSSVCDFGYGNGSFLKYCEDQKIITYGYDISDYPVPPRTIRVQNLDTVHVDVMTFFDSMEHILDEDLVTFLQQKKTKHFCISVPWYHEAQGTEWFENWKHRRPNEHIHHFDVHGLIGLLLEVGCKIVYVGNPEDKIRTPSSNLPNILTVIGTRI
jgi:hypothetical protein